MTKCEQTREMTLASAAEVFNHQGCFGMSMSALNREISQEKCGIYNQFTSKDELALQAFDYAIDLIRQALPKALQGKRHPIARLQAVIDVFQRIALGNPLSGGCPIRNIDIDAEVAHSPLRRRAEQAMNAWPDFVRHTVRKGIELGEIPPEVDADGLATLMLSTLECALMLALLCNDNRPLSRIAQCLTQHLENTVRA
jgi:AcrR family transcriptional regulator